MPTLKDTEWRVLCVIVRQTLGWKEAGSGQRKARDWLTHRQLKARTGRSSEAVCRAVEGLVKRQLIVVTNGAGEALRTPAQRRRCLGPLFYSLASGVLDR